jgi:hypothetical protein
MDALIPYNLRGRGTTAELRGKPSDESNVVGWSRFSP